jgi:hypothetical protein
MKTYRTGFAPVHPRSRGGHYIAVFGVRSTATDARVAAASWYDDQNYEQGWKRAKKAGYRIRKVRVTLDGDDQ